MALVSTRIEHFRLPSLLDSQLRDLEPLQPDECGITLDLRGTPAALAEQCRPRLDFRFRPPA
jgi:gluconokinase